MGEQPRQALLAETLRSEQRQRWEAGEHILAEIYLQQHPELLEAPEYALELIYHEVVLRQEQGETPPLVEYLERFPQFASQLKPLFDVHRALESDRPFDLESTKTATGPSRTTAAVPSELPIIPGYEIVKELGRGGMGVVYWAWQMSLNRAVALKMVLAGSHASSGELERFRTEAEAIARLHHPNIVQIYDVGRHGAHPYMTLEYVEGGSLAQKLTGAPQPARQAAQLVETLARAVHSAHEHGIIHRDLTPGNVLLTADGAPKITDFGLAKLVVGGREVRTQSGAIVGTPSYMAPEQAAGRGKEIGPATDVYALGTILYEMLTGRPPFRAETPLETLIQVQADEPVPPSRLQPKLPRDVATICLKCLEKDPSKRYGTAVALAEDLRRFLAGESILARPVGSPEKLWRWCRRKPVVTGLAASVAFLLIVITLVSTLSALWLGRERIETKKQLVNAYLSQVQALRGSGRAGHRFTSLQILGDTAKLVRSLKLDDEYIPKLRNEAIACLALFDLSLEKEWDGWSPNESSKIDFDGALAHYARADRKGAVSIRRVEDDAEILRLPAHGYAGSSYNFGLYSLWWSRDGKFLAVESEPDHGLKVWRLAERKCIVETEAAFTSKMGAADFSPDGRELVVGHQDGTLSLHDLSSGQPPRQLQPGLTAIGHLAFHPKKRQVAVACIPDVRICDLESGKVVTTLPMSRGASWVAWNPEGTTVAASGAGTDFKIYLWDPATRKQTQVLGGHDSGGIAFNFNHRGDLLASTGWERVLRLWDPRTGRQLFNTPAAILIPRFSPDDRLAAAIDGTQLRLFKVTVSRGYRTLVRGPVLDGEGYRATAFSPDGRLLAAAMWDGVGLWDAASGTASGFLPLGDTADVLFEPSGALLTNSRAGVLRWPIQVAPTSTGVVRIGPPHKLPLPAITHIACSQDGKVLAMTQGDGGLVLHNDRPNELVRAHHHYDVRNIAISPDGRLVATGSHWGLHVKVWEARTGNLVVELPVGPVAISTFSPDGRWLAARGGSWGVCRLWAVDSWREGPAIDTSMLPAFAFSPDSKLLAVGTSQGIIRLVDPDTGREYARMEDPNQQQIETLTFSPDGTQLVVTAGAGQSCHVWDLRDLGQSLAQLGLAWELPSSLRRGSEDGRQPLRLCIELDAPHYERRAQIHSRAHEYAEAIADFQRALEHDPNRALACNALAWIYVTGPTQLRDADKALSLALKATQVAPNDSDYQNTLGVVHYRLGQYRQAIDALERNVQNSKGEANDFFFLAMSYQQLGDLAKARDHYERGLRWWQGQANLPPNHIEELTAFRAEAEALLKKEALQW
jgi:serine/threonine protein kinase/WD40 repeat protein